MRIWLSKELQVRKRKLENYSRSIMCCQAYVVTFCEFYSGLLKNTHSLYMHDWRKWHLSISSILSYPSLLSYHIHLFYPILSYPSLLSYLILSISSILSYHIHLFYPILSISSILSYLILSISSILSYPSLLSYHIHLFYPIISISSILSYPSLLSYPIHLFYPILSYPSLLSILPVLSMVLNFLCLNPCAGLRTIVVNNPDPFLAKRIAVPDAMKNIVSCLPMTEVCQQYNIWLKVQCMIYADIDVGYLLVINEVTLYKYWYRYLLYTLETQVLLVACCVRSVLCET